MAEPNYAEVVSKLRKTFLKGRTRPLEWRRQQLDALNRMLEEEKDRIVEALQKDLRKHKMEAVCFEINMVRNDITLMQNHLEEWTGPQKVSKPLANMADKPYIQCQPLGVALILSAWNYPFQLLFLPMVGAIAAGNCCVLKPSDLAEHTAALAEELVPKYMDKDCFAVVNGGIPETTALLKERFDYIFYTGNSMVAKIIMAAASKHLTPVTLELGGKSPVYVHDSSSLDIVANRVMWGKTANAGQTCIAPDYLMCSEKTRDKLVEEIKNTLKRFHPEGSKKAPDYSRIINQRHFNRVKNLMEKSGKVVVGGGLDEADKYIEPTVIVDVKPTDPIMQEEVFGPVLPIMTVKDEDEALDIINGREKPLALYVFANNSAVTQKMLKGTTSGSACVNDVIMQCALDTLPFGGVGNSGTGAYHGKYTFDTFSHQRSVMERGQGMEAANNLRYPPYSDKKANTIDWLTKTTRRKTGLMAYLPFLLAGVVIAFVAKIMGMEKYLPASLK